MSETHISLLVFALAGALWRCKGELDLENLGDFCSPQSSTHLYLISLCRNCQVLRPRYNFLHSPAWVELPWTCFLGQEKEPGLERPALLGKMQSLSHQLCPGGVASAQKKTCQASLEKNNDKQLALRVKPGEQCPRDHSYIKSKSSFILMQISDP